MSLAGSINNFYRKYKKPLSILVLMFFVYKLFDYYYGNVYEGLTQPKCLTYNNCNDCVKNSHEGDATKPCLWNNDKGPNGKIIGCSEISSGGNSRTCPPVPPPKPPAPKAAAKPAAKAAAKPAAKAAAKPAAKAAAKAAAKPAAKAASKPAAKAASKLNPSPISSCPQCKECPELILLDTPTFITRQK